MTHDHNKPSRTITREGAIQIHLMLMDGWFLNRIAAHFDVDQDRVSEIKNHKTHVGSYDEAVMRRRAA